MSRDPRETQGAGRAAGAAADPRGPLDPERSAALVTAYVDGVAELLPGERHGVEALLVRDPAARAEADAVHALIDRLRALPPEGGEPDWAAMERSIRQAVAAAHLVARPWWRRWQWLVPAMTCATAAAVLLVIWPRSAPRRALQRPPQLADAEPAKPSDAATPDEASVVALWLDGHEVDVDVSAPDELGDVGLELGDAQAPQPIEDADGAGLLPPADLAWVDTLDDAALDRAERWLAKPEPPIRPDRRPDAEGSRGEIPGPGQGQGQSQRKI